MVELNNSLESFKNILDQAEERTSELKDRSFEIIHSKEQIVKKKKKRNEKNVTKAYGTYGAQIKKTMNSLWESQNN